MHQWHLVMDEFLSLVCSCFFFSFFPRNDKATWDGAICWIFGFLNFVGEGFVRWRPPWREFICRFVAGRVMACDRDSIHNPLSRGQETRKCAIYCATRLHAYTTSKVATCPHGLFGSYAISLASTCLFFWLLCSVHHSSRWDVFIMFALYNNIDD